MEKLLSSESIMVLIVLLMPGYIYGRVKRWTTQRQPESEEGIAGAIYLNLARSLMLLMVMLFGVGPQTVHALLGTLSGGNPAVLFAGMAPTLMSALLLIVAPAVFGVAVGVLEVNEVFGIVRGKLGLPRIVPNQAWDVALAAAQANGAGFLILEIERRGNAPVLGRYGANSAVSRNGGYRDVFLEEIWQVVDGALVPSDAGGILVRGAEIQTVRFIRIPS